MRKNEWSGIAVLVEITSAILEMIYLVLQIYYGLSYGVQPYKWILNILMSLLVYTGLQLLVFYPERINRLSPEICVGEVRKFSIRMVRLIKFVFVAGLMIPSVADAFGVFVPEAYSLIVILCMLVLAGFYEIKIIRLLKK